MKTFFLLAALLIAGTCFSQDFIVKKDQTEIKSKVLEITETAIKYKKFENLEGPTYNISKADVFMIIYSSGQREVIQSANAVAANTSQNPNSNRTTLSNNYNPPAPQTSGGIDTVVDYKNIRIKYSPLRLMYGFEEGSSFNLRIESESRIVKNVLNFGFLTYLSSYGGATATTYGLYLAPYAAVNRLTSNYISQDKGLFVHARLGYAATSVSYSGESATTSGLVYGLGLDYFISKGFGLTGSMIKFGEGAFTFQAGIAFKF